MASWTCFIALRSDHHLKLYSVISHLVYPYAEEQTLNLGQSTGPMHMVGLLRQGMHLLFISWWWWLTSVTEWNVLLHRSTAQHSTAQHSTAQHSTAQHSTAQHSTMRLNVTCHSTAQHNAAERHMP